MRLISRTGLVVTVLAIGAIAVPIASADPSHSGWNPAPSGTVVSPNPDQQGGVTSSRDGLTEPRLRAAWLSAAYARAAKAGARSYVTTAPSSLSATHASTASGSQGFHLGDAAIGGGLIAVLMLIGVAGVFTVRRHGQLHYP